MVTGVSPRRGSAWGAATSASSGSPRAARLAGRTAAHLERVGELAPLGGGQLSGELEHGAVEGFLDGGALGPQLGEGTVRGGPIEGLGSKRLGGAQLRLA